ncbi:LPS export ABC transporter permease LptG [Sphingomonas quercus]|uniref:LPS export ABC transporter permease LptG n=1 Tax=Sphingomonas quercus TaxID=2842451 RepID=A0ABS6BFQ4_9SPHN|nr:LPS export ABC transporter permease LptG [Sphingomonas quercus]MBU3077120.1 LPS export ABC transporter permease LptG [Sphingomonas quercus]
MALRFFPSRQLTFYLARTFLTRSLAVLALLVLVLQTLDLLGTSGQILAHPGNGQAEIWRYVGLRVPQIVARFLPFAVLLGTLITLATLNQNSEVIAMKASGASAHQIIAPLIVASIGVALFSFMFNERIVARSTASLNAWEAVDWGPVPRATGVSSNVWVRSGDDLVHAATAQGRGAATRLNDVIIYDRTGGSLVSIVSGKTGQQVAGGWRLDDVTRFDVASGKLTTRPSVVLPLGVRPDQFTLADVSADDRSLAQLRQDIDYLKAAGRPTGPLEAGMWHKMSGPLSAVLMPLLAGVAAFGLARSGALFVRVVTGMGLGFAYFVADNAALAMGNLGAYPPFLAAWAPFLLFLMIGEAVLIRTEE